MSVNSAKIDVVVSAVVDVTPEVKRFEFQRQDGQRLPTFSGGAHIVVEMDDHGTRRLNPYSLMSDPSDPTTYAISVRRDDRGRGGSLFLHRQLKVGDRTQISAPNNFFSLDRTASKHVMVAGGIGITPFLSQIKQLKAQRGRLGTAGKADFELHYFTRGRDVAAYADDLDADDAVKVHHYFGASNPTEHLAGVMSRQPLGTHLYICGPKPMIEAVRAQALQAGWPVENVHHEEFAAPQPGEAFEVQLKASGISVQVGEKQSMLEALEAAGVNPPFMCRGGACGQCETRVVSCDGSIDHRDHWLDHDQKASNSHIMPCLSRFNGKSLVIDR